jgi:hypothetical protein
MPKPVILEIHTGRKLARAAARGLKRSGRASRVSVKRDGALYRVRGVASDDWDESHSPEEYPKRLRYAIARRRTRKAGTRKLARCRRKYEAHYQLLRSGGSWILATFDRAAWEALGRGELMEGFADPHREFSSTAADDDHRATRVFPADD